MTLLDSGAAITVGPLRTVPNYITAVRTVAAVTVGIVALVFGSVALMAVSYGIYWIGDVLDGWAARRLGQETRAGAVFDIVSDRACTAVLCVGLVSLVPDVAVVAVVFLLSFLVLDTMLSLAFLCWPVLSPNYFHLVDRRVWALNWSPVAKVANTAGVIGAIAFGQYLLALGVAVAVVAVKLWSVAAVVRLLERDGRA
ncbi:CDP-diacylglycerol--glycerol-3-phosphate 3-phosp hatidyltransferase [Micromonospora saelicesensis]|uniref:CDP-diacylglycerol--glycerol-3-phosphate 3-phosp hatidyltransferase n=1 Tax=Micromonospora saelicesensis TaxID=285676 RepID=A0A328NIH7_9ACTN|nr:CDP-alcohol phosphatidyltransferase family protein [Micromonospora saelicesensis]RAO31509.1 CDP-diacylglycerol--glycerol-3-phosphate 3-phosp hatidyltransferase [Micromonospora saelicesensis]